MAPKNPPGMKINLKLLVDKKSQKVLYAEAGKQFVDFLFGLLHILIGTMIGSGCMMKEGGSLHQIYKSAAVLCTTHLQPNFMNSKDSILMPITSTKHCKLGVENHDQGFGGYVKGKIIYMVLDDLTVKPMSALSSIRLVNELKIEDVSSLEEVIVVVGFKQCVELLMSSFVSDTVLTDVLYHNKNGLEGNCDADEGDENEVDNDGVAVEDQEEVGDYLQIPW